MGERVWKFIIMLGMISQYQEIGKRIGVESEIVDPEMHPELLNFLVNVIAEQYDKMNWVHKHVGRKIELKQKPIHASETF